MPDSVTDDSIVPLLIDTKELARLLAVSTQTVKRMNARVRFNVADRDTLRLTGGLSPGPGEGFNPNGAPVTFDIGGLQLSFTLDEKGRATNAQGVLAISPRQGFRTFSLRLKKGNFASNWTDEGMLNETMHKVPITIRIVLTLGGGAYTGNYGMLYTAKAGKVGTAR